MTPIVAILVLVGLGVGALVALARIALLREDHQDHHKGARS